MSAMDRMTAVRPCLVSGQGRPICDIHGLEFVALKPPVRPNGLTPVGRRSLSAKNTPILLAQTLLLHLARASDR